MTSRARPPLPPDARTLPARYYTDPEQLARELERLFLGGWFCAGRAADAPAPGDYFLAELAGESVIVVRGKDGVLRAFHNVCRHRGTRLCTEAAGRFGGTIQCVYHAWTYDLGGRLVGAPGMDDAPAFRREEHPLVPVALELWDGLVFLGLASSPPPLAARLEDLPARFAPWGMAELRRARRVEYEVAANWKLVVTNYSECLHCPTLHPQLQRLSHHLSGDNEPPRPGYLGGRMELRPGIETMSRDGSRPRAYLPGLPEAERRHVHYYAILPNLLLSLHPDYVMTHTLWPLAPDRTRVVWEILVHPDELARGTTIDDAIAFWDETNRQDWLACELSQAGIASRGYRPGSYTSREELLWAFDRMIVEATG